MSQPSTVAPRTSDPDAQFNVRTADILAETACWTATEVEAIARNILPELAPIAELDVVPIGSGLDFWDMWPIARVDGSTAIVDGRSWWFFLAVPRAADPERRHDNARIRLASYGEDGWRDHEWVFEPGFTPGSREWSGSAILGADGQTLTIHFTAAGRPAAPASIEQRLFETRGRFRVVAGVPSTDGFELPVETAIPDPLWYAGICRDVPASGTIRCCRDPGFFRDPADGRDYLLFTGSAAGTDSKEAGVIGLARLDVQGWTTLAPLVSAVGVNSELERPHVVVHAGRYHLFWSTHAKRFATGLSAPTGLYAMIADRMEGPWRPANGSGLVACNPVCAPVQAYCWWVTGELDVISFIDYWGVSDPCALDDVDLRRRHFGGTVAPSFRLRIDGDEICIDR